MKLQLPEPALVWAGAVGGPLCMFLFTPLRNAMTLASQNPDRSVWEVYSSVFAEGFGSGWTGGSVTVLPSCPQFIVLGPLFRFLEELFGNAVPAVVFTAIAETLVTYGPQALNAQLAFNADQQLCGQPTVALSSPLLPFGPGAFFVIARNVCAMSGIRILSKPCQAVLQQLGMPATPSDLLSFSGDFVASIISAVFSAPLNQLFSYAVTSEKYMRADPMMKVDLMLQYLQQSYLVYASDGELVGFSSTFGRDLLLRCIYLSVLMSFFAACERFCVALWKRCGTNLECERSR